MQLENANYTRNLREKLAHKEQMEYPFYDDIPNTLYRNIAREELAEMSFYNSGKLELLTSLGVLGALMGGIASKSHYQGELTRY